ncbi:MAG: hypothetical protein WC711_03995 [Candidatus Staskawiczbacteria bacterium]|jgi:hypothetical protein
MNTAEKIEKQLKISNLNLELITYSICSGFIYLYIFLINTALFYIFGVVLGIYTFYKVWDIGYTIKILKGGNKEK